MMNTNNQGKREKQSEFSIQMFGISVLVLIVLGLVFLIKYGFGI
jgi:hypothetical protein